MSHERNGKPLGPSEDGIGPRRSFGQAGALAAWRRVHQLEIDDVALLTQAQLFVVLANRLCQLPSDDPCSQELKARVQELLGRASTDDADVAALVEEARALLQRVLTVVFDARDTAFEDCATVYLKALWLCGLALAAIALLGAAFKHGDVFFLVGAVGGTLSRLNRITERRPRANDYGASWSTLVLAPVAGALAGWLGVMLAEAATGAGVLPEDTFDGVFSQGATGTHFMLALGIAFVFGFSERLINRAVAAAEARVVPSLPDPTAKTA